MLDETNGTMFTFFSGAGFFRLPHSPFSVRSGPSLQINPVREICCPPEQVFQLSAGDAAMYLHLIYVRSSPSSSDICSSVYLLSLAQLSL